MGNLCGCWDVEVSDKICRRKLVIVGDGGCGKSCLLFRMLGRGFQGDVYLPTVFETEVLTLDHEGQQVELVLYDTAGQEDYDRLRPFAYPDTDVILACFALDDPDSLVNVHERWIPEVRHFCGSDVPVLLVGTKADLRHQESSNSSAKDNCSFHGSLDSILLSEEEQMQRLKRRKRPLVTGAEARELAQRKGLVGYFESSAKANTGVSELLHTALSAALHPRAFLKKRRRRSKPAQLRPAKGSSKFSKMC